MRYLLPILVFLFSSQAFAQTSKDNPIHITKDSLAERWDFVEAWRHTTEDSIAFAQKDYNDDSWDTVSGSYKVKIDLAKENNKKKPSDIGWYRYYFTTDTSLLNTPLNLAMRHSGASEVYLDGELLAKIGEINVKGKSLYKTLKNNINLFAFKDTGLHVLAVRYENYKSEEAIDENSDFGFYLSIEKAEKSVKEQLELTDKITFYCILIFGVFIALAFVHFLLFIFYRSAIYNLYFGLFNLSMALISMAVYLKWGSENPLIESFALKSVFYSMCLWCFSITSFVNTLFGRHKKRLLVMRLICLGIFLSVFIHEGVAYSLVSMFFISVSVEAFIVIIKAMMRKERGAFIVGFGILFLAAFVITLFIVSFLSNGINLSEDSIGRKAVMFVAITAIICIPISISAYLPWRFANVNKDLEKQLDNVKALSEKNLQQEKEKKQILETQNERLEKEVAERTEEIRIEKQKSDDLLLNILPSEIAEELKIKGESKAQKYDEVSVLFTDFVNFTKTSEQLGVEELLNELNINFTAFDRIMEKHGLEKIKTIGDAYLAVSGLPNENPRHAQNAVNAALDILEFVKKRKTEVPYGLDIRIGINSGSLIAGIIGVKKFAYDIWGDTVNTAARMEQSSEPGKVNVSENTYRLVQAEFNCEYRGKVDAKGKGEMDMYFVKGANPAIS